MTSSPPVHRLAAEIDQVLIVVNPTAGAGAGKDHVDRLVSALGRLRMKPCLVSSLTEVADRAEEVHAAGRLRAVVGAGGDGTIAELFNRIPPGAPLTMLPLGTENL